MRLIDADAVEKITWQDPSYTDPLNVLTEVREKVRALPTVDAVPVIHCYECKYFFGDGYDECTLMRANSIIAGINNKRWYSDFYCAWAERKEE